MRALELIEVGDEIGVILPTDVLARLKVGQGDMLHLSETTRAIMLTLNDTSDGRIKADVDEPTLAQSLRDHTAPR